MSSDEKAIRDLVALWISASKAGDSATIMNLMSDNVIFMAPGGRSFGKNEFAAMPSGELTGDAEVLEVQVQGDWAWARNYLNITFAPTGGQPCPLTGYTMGIYRKNAARQWQLFRDANLVCPTSTKSEN